MHSVYTQMTVKTLQYNFCLKFDSSTADLVDPGYTRKK